MLITLKTCNIDYQITKVETFFNTKRITKKNYNKRNVGTTLEVDKALNQRKFDTHLEVDKALEITIN